MYATDHVLAGAYLRGDTRRVYLSHLVELGEDGWGIRVMCRRVKFENMTNDTSQFTQDRPTCADCARRYDALAKPTAGL